MSFPWPPHGWYLITRLGEAQILLPTALLLALWLARRADAARLALAWMIGLFVAILITTLSKVAFIGFAVGVPALNFTGVSGHAMFSAAIYPLVFGALASSLSLAAQRRTTLLGAALALLIGVSRVQVWAHTWSEVVAGLALGFLAAAAALWVARMPHVRVPWWMPLTVAVWLLVTPTQAPPSRTHDMVTRLALTLSGRPEPYTRRAMLADWRRQQASELKPSLPP